MSICGTALMLGGVPIYRWNKYEVTTILPIGYTPVEYIQSGGAQYIDTRLKPNQNTRVTIDAQFVSFTSEVANALFGARETSGYSACYWFRHNTLSCFYGGYGSDVSYQWKLSDVNGRKLLVFDKNVVSVDGVSHTYNASTFQSAYNLTLFAMNEANTIRFYASARLYSCKIYEGNTLVRDFVPCKNASGVVGLYDIVNGAFYANAGSGTFTAGAESENLVVGDFIEEVKSLNSNAYPDGGIQDGYYYELV